MTTSAKVRSEIIEYLQRELVGPAPGFPAVQINGEEILRSQDPPRLRYSAGILFPMRAEVPGQQDLDAKEVQDADAGPTEEVAGATENETETNLSDSPIPTDQQPETELDLNLANQYLPSAMGVSGLLRVPKQLVIRIEAARYEKTELAGFGSWKSKSGATSAAWLRRPIVASVTLNSSELISNSVVSFEKPVQIEGSETKLVVNVVSRPSKDESENVRLVTFTLINRNESLSRSNDELCYFQCRFEIADQDGSECFLVYPDQANTNDPEEQALRFLYRKRKVFAVGHGCSCDWTETGSGGCTRVWTEVLPVYELKPIEHVDLPGISFSMAKLAEGDSEAITLCESLADAYDDWITSEQSKLTNVAEVPPQFLELAKANLQQCKVCLARLRVGIELLRSQRVVREAFALANRAMFLQQAHYDLATNNVRQWAWKDNNIQLTQPYKAPDYARKAVWRPFQLAFLLMNLESMINPDSEERNIVDLIWFPTGGGKTEAYLGLSAFTILLRRLLNPEDAGTTVLMRYTLRLLTTQQFQRAASLICACEYLRRSQPKKLGSAAISIGLWVGGSVTPNDHKDAVSALTRLYQSPNENRFIVLACPWCGAAMGPVKAGSNWKVKGYQKVSKPARVVFRCEDPDCPFNTELGLPLTVVDQAIYEEPPTLVIGTVDKFAMLPWRPDSRSLFGLSHDYPAPELIIQDELHLISGPLGSMVAHYEMAIEALCRAGKTKYPPKIVASTATISRANEQIRALYNGRSGFLFPPQGLDVGNSFFAEEKPSRPGRRYLGVFATALPSHVTAQIRVVSALLQSVKSIDVKDPKLLDPFWTLMIYFNSIRELGHAATLIRADIRENMNAMWDRQGLTKNVSAESLKERRFINRDLELTSRIQSNQIPEVLAELFNRLGPTQDYSVVDVCLATNMIQVGLDVQRLSLMAIIGQPKTTAEYIQASSRVGRKEPGLVVTIYNPARPRDRSHYEHFRAYHQSIYRFVEPTSVTPFADPVIERALHAVTVALIRMLGGDALSERPNSPPPDDELLGRIRSIIENRVSKVDQQQQSAALERLDYIISEWKRVPPSKYGGFGPPDPEEPLMYPSGSERHPRWSIRPLPTPSSMRNVDATCDAAVLSTFPDPD
jgi:hypothetical protein